MRPLAPLIAFALFLASCASRPAAQLDSTPAASVEGRPIRATAINADRNLPRVLIIGAIHGDELEALTAIEPLRQCLRESCNATVYLIENVNPDGSARRVRWNSRGVDLNRNWPARNFTTANRHGPEPLSEPETRFVHACIDRFRPELIIVCHSARNGPFVNYDGPAEAIAAAFVQAARADDPRWHVRASMGYPTPGSLGTYAGVDQQIPILTVEFARGHDADHATRAMIQGTHAAIAAMPSR